MHILQHFSAAFCPFLFVPFLLRVLALSRSGIREDTHGHSHPVLPCAPREQMVSLTKELLSMSLVGLMHKENSYWHNCSSVQESQAMSLLSCLSEFSSFSVHSKLHWASCPPYPTPWDHQHPHWLCLQPRKGRMISRELWALWIWPFGK